MAATAVPPRSHFEFGCIVGRGIQAALQGWWKLLMHIPTLKLPFYGALPIMDFD
jgi:hypothetical protein